MLLNLISTIILAGICQGFENLKVSISPPITLEGNEVKIQCKFSSERRARFQWIDMPPQATSPRRMSEDNSTIVIKSLQRSDDANYQCIATTDDGKTYTSSRKLNVFYAPQVVTLRLEEHGEPVARHDHQGPAQLAVAKGASLTLICDGDSKPNIMPTWKVGSVEINHWFATYTVAEPLETVYTCQASYELTKDTYTVSVNVTVQDPVSKPQVKTNNTEVMARGDAVTMSCSHDMGTQPEYVWLQNNQPISAQEERHEFLNGGAALLVKNVQQRDTGDYQCTVQNGVSKETSEPVRMTVLDPVSKPQVKMNNKEVLARGDAVTMICSHDMGTQPEYVWLQNNQPISAQEERHEFLNGGAALLVENVQQSDAGDYQCTVQNGVSKETSEPVRITVLEPVSKPQVKTNNTEVLERGDAMTMICSHDMGTQPEYVWLQNNQPVSAQEERHEFINGGAALFVENVQQRDTGDYQCTVQNGVSKETSEPVRITVLEPVSKPQVKMNNKEVLARGDAVTMSCSHDMGTQPEYVWLRNNQPVSAQEDRHEFLNGGAALLVENIQQRDTGDYQCTVQNGVSKETSEPVRITVLEPVSKPQVKTNNTEVLARGDAVTMTCLHDMGTQPEYVWLRNNQPVSAQEERHEFLNGGAALLVENVQQRDTGDYQCTVQNGVSKETSEPVRITVLEPVSKPQVKMNNKEVLARGDAVTMTCSHDMGTQPEYVWLRNNQPVSAQEERHEFLNGGAALLVENIQQRDTGDYQCTVQNGVSKETSEPMRMTVLEPVSKPQVKMNNKEVLARGDAVTMTCLHDMGTQPEYVWLQNNQPVSAQEERHEFLNGGAVVLVENVQQRDAGDYQCTVQNGVSKETSEPVRITVLEPVSKAQVKMNNKEVLARGDTVTMSCSHDMGTQPEYVWLRNNQPVSAQEERHEFLNGGAAVLVENVQQRDTGDYQCTVQNGVSKETSEPVRMTVLEPVSKPQVKMNNKEVLARGDAVTMSCSHDLGTQPEYVWLRNNQPVSAQEDRHEFLNGGAALLVENIQQRDTGDYQCTVQNGVSKETSESVRITVLEPVSKPQVKINNTEVLARGDAVTMICLHDMGTQPEYAWLRNNQPVSAQEERHEFLNGGAALLVENVQQRDAGDYQCTVQNGVSKETSEPVRITVLEPVSKPQVKMNNKEVLARGDAVTMTCLHDMGTQPEYVWLRNNQPVSAQEERHEFLNGGAALFVENVQQRDAGDYQCTVQNGVSKETSEPVRITVLEPVSKPRVDMDRMEVAEGTGSVTMTCSHDTSAQPEYVWLRNNQPVSAQEERHEFLNGGAALLVQNVQLGDAGIYRCTVQNGVSKETSEPVRMTVLVPAESLPKPDIKINDSVTGNGVRVVRMDCLHDGPASGRVSYAWLLNARPVTEEPRKYELAAGGASLLVMAAAHGVSGEFQCEVRDGRSSSRSEPVKLPPHARARSSPQVILGATLGTLVAAAAAGLVVWTYRKVALSRSYDLWNSIKGSKGPPSSKTATTSV